MKGLERFREVLSLGLAGNPDAGSALAGSPSVSAFVDACAAHFALVLKWNPTHNLTRVTDEGAGAVLHYLDCVLPLLALRQPAPPVSFIDVGSGAGFPGVIAALLWPAAEASLIEPARKRASFLQVAAGELGLSHVKVLEPPPALSSLGRGAGAAASSTLTSALVLTRATFSAGQRSNLWPWVAPQGQLVAWATHHELSTWSTEASTWAEAGKISWQPYTLPELAPAASPAEASPMLRGTVQIQRR